jgi:hypothetical protein
MADEIDNASTSQGGMEESGDEVALKRRHPKKRRVVSKEFVNDEEEEGLTGPRRDGWMTFELTTSCLQCTNDGAECRTFVRR